MYSVKTIQIHERIKSALNCNCNRRLSRKVNKRNYYTIYDSKTQTLVAVGDAEECAVKMNMSMHSFYSTITRVKNGKNKKYEVEIAQI